MFHTGASNKGDFPSFEGGGEVGRFINFPDLASVKAKAAELKRIVKAWCDQRDAA